MALGLRVVSDDGGPERFRQALFRALAVVRGDLDVLRRTRGDLQPAVVEGQTHRRRIRRHRGDQRARTEAVTTAGDAAVRWPGGRRRCSCPALAPNRPSWPANSSLGHRNWIPRSAIRWRIGSQATSSHGSRHHHRLASRRSTCLPPCWPNGTAGSWRRLRPDARLQTQPPQQWAPRTTAVPHRRPPPDAGGFAPPS